MKSIKAPGIDYITGEMLKTHPTLSAQMLHHLFSDIWETATFPTDWMQGILVKVPEKGDLTEYGNWCGITLLCITLKVLCKVILIRIQEKIDADISKPSSEPVDYVWITYLRSESYKSKTSFHLVFVNFEKAFDRPNLENIWAAQA